MSDDAIPPLPTAMPVIYAGNRDRRREIGMMPK